MVELIKDKSRNPPAGMPTFELNYARQGNIEPLMNYFGRHRPYLTGLLLAGLGEQAAFRYFVDAFKKAKRDLREVKGRSSEAVKKRTQLRMKMESLSSLIQKQVQVLVGKKEYGYAAFNLNNLGSKAEVEELAKQCERHALREKSKALMEQAIYINERLLKDKEKAATLTKKMAHLK